MRLQTRAARGLLGAIVIVAATSACGDLVRQGRAPVMLEMDSLMAASGATASPAFSTVLFSDVITNRTSPAPCSPTSPCPTVFSDPGQATFHLVAKNPSIAPTDLNSVTINLVRINYTRTDGRSTPGVDLPYSFDQAVSVTVSPTGTTVVPFEMVRHAAKEEPPLAQLVVNPNIIRAIAQVTFYGRDQVGNDVSASGSVNIEFGNFGDTQ